jgi:hypothetical protein
VSQDTYMGVRTESGPIIIVRLDDMIFDLVEVAARGGITDPGPIGWGSDDVGTYVSARLILWHATQDMQLVNDLDTTFARDVMAATKGERWELHRDCVLAWAVRHNHLRHQLRTLYGRNCPGCG